MSKPGVINSPEFFQRYINEVKEDDLIIALRKQMPAAEVFFASISEEFSTRKYAEGKWTIKEILQHLIDAERVFNYRAMCIARGEQATLPPFDENNYAENSNANAREWKDIIAEFAAVRKSTEYLFNSFSDDMMQKTGNVSTYSINVATIGFVTAGHLNHHIKIIQERYIGV